MRFEITVDAMDDDAKALVIEQAHAPGHVRVISVTGGPVAVRVADLLAACEAAQRIMAEDEE